MKKILVFTALFILVLCTSVNATTRKYGCTALIGGAAGALDALDITGASTPNPNSLAEGDVASVYPISGETVTSYTYIFDASGTDAEASPNIIRPDDYATAGVWRLVVIVANSITVPASADPTILMNDSSAAAGTGKIFANSTGVYDVVITLGVEDSTGESTPYIEVDGVTETIDMLKPTTLQAGDIIGSEITVITASEWLPIGWAEDGTTPPAATTAITGTTRNKGRAFSATVDNDVTFIWQVPKDFSGSTVTVQVTGIVSAATAPANGEIVHFTVAMGCWANSEVSTIAEGTLQATALTADATYVQYDGLTTVTSSAITPSGSIAAGETCAIKVVRLAATTDTYTQLFDVTGININYLKQLAN